AEARRVTGDRRRRAPERPRDLPVRGAADEPSRDGDEQLRPLAVIRHRERLPGERRAAHDTAKPRDAPAPARAVEPVSPEAIARRQTDMLRTPSTGAEGGLKPRQVLDRSPGPLHDSPGFQEPCPTETAIFRKE